MDMNGYELELANVDTRLLNSFFFFWFIFYVPHAHRICLWCPLMTIWLIVDITSWVHQLTALHVVLPPCCGDLSSFGQVVILFTAYGSYTGIFLTLWNFKLIE